MEEMKMKVSVVVPVYQVPHMLLERCLESLMAQTLDGVEVLLVFDEPAQSYMPVIRAYDQKLNLRVLEQAHQGVSAARNLGMQHAQGEWIAAGGSGSCPWCRCCDGRAHHGVRRDIPGTQIYGTRNVFCGGGKASL